MFNDRFNLCVNKFRRGLENFNVILFYSWFCSLKRNVETVMIPVGAWFFLNSVLDCTLRNSISIDVSIDSATKIKLIGTYITNWICGWTNLNRLHHNRRSVCRYFSMSTQPSSDFSIRQNKCTANPCSCFSALILW